MLFLVEKYAHEMPTKIARRRDKIHPHVNNAWNGLMTYTCGCQGEAENSVAIPNHALH